MPWHLGSFSNRLSGVMGVWPSNQRDDHEDGLVPGRGLMCSTARLLAWYEEWSAGSDP